MISTREREQLVRDVARLRAIEGTSSESAELAPIRRHLEELAGKTIPRASAARVLGVSQNSLDRWIRLGDVPAVMTPGGRYEIPRSELVSLLAALERVPSDPHPLARVLRDRRRLAADLDADTLAATLRTERRSGHARAELNGLAYHRVVAERIDDQIVAAASERVDRWESEGKIDPRTVAEWRRLLALPYETIAIAISEDTERARELRQTSPLAGVLTEAERQRVRHAVDSALA